MDLNEHLEKRNKDFSRWIEDVCRDCKHKRLFHLFNESDITDKKYLHSNCNFVLEVGGFCMCLEYMPSDNLDYIEILAKKKGLIPDEEGKNE